MPVQIQKQIQIQKSRARIEERIRGTMQGMQGCGEVQIRAGERRAMAMLQM